MTAHREVRLTLEITTDLAMSALVQTHYVMLVNASGERMAAPIQVRRATARFVDRRSKTGAELALLLGVNLRDVGLPVSVTHRLQDAGIRKLRDLVRRSEQEMLRVKGFGRWSLNMTKEVLRERGLYYNMDLPDTADHDLDG